MATTRSWQLPVGSAVVAVAFVGAVIGATPAASSQPATECTASELTASGPLLTGCEGGGR